MNNIYRVKVQYINGIPTRYECYRKGERDYMCTSNCTPEILNVLLNASERNEIVETPDYPYGIPKNVKIIDLRM